MLPAERRRRIAAEVAARPSVKTEELAELFSVSGETIRRDLLRLQGDGLVERVHGGATPAERPRAVEDSYAQRRALNVAGKQAMARAAVSLLRPGDTVILDVGTSVAEIARAIPVTWTGRVLTNSLPVGAELADRPGVEVLVSGGRTRSGDLALAGGQTVAFFADYYADLAFLGSGGVHPAAGLTDYHSDEVDVRRVMLDHSTRCYAIADATKLGVIAARHVCPLDRLTGLISDGTPDEGLAEALATAGVRLVGPDDTGRAEADAS
ncbi:DeoR/GlpR family DNA-binding transcription regulator [Sphaerisporangium sp. NBC_01403]|uniref:DeoR/GlpR family DNA-binding transcription regulator n=1 Tax=Sphaerisporangium TaxID=321315 RepID=UPI00324AD4F9